MIGGLKARVLVLCALLFTGLSAEALQLPPGPQNPKYAVQSQLVQIFLTLMDGTRRVTDLRLSDFSLSEDGDPKAIDRLDSESVPLQIALLLDTSDSMREALKETQEAAVSFIQSLKAGDRVTLIPFNSNIRTIPQLSDDFEPVIRAIRGTRPELKTRLYDSILQAMKTLAGKEGRRAIVVFTDGEDTSSTASLNLVLNAASRYGYPIYAVGAGIGMRSPSFRDVMRQISGINNGRMFFVETARELRSAFLEVSSELRAAFVLYYYTLKIDERWHDLSVAVTNPRYKVFSRKGFYSGKNTGSAAAPELGRKTAERGGIEEPDPETVKENAKAALAEVVKANTAPRRIEPVVDNSTAVRGLIRVESHLVEVPVLVESLDGKEPPIFTEKDFQIFEDNGLREIAYFKGALKTEELERARDLAKARAGAAIAPMGQSTGEELVLGKYYLVLDDLTSNIPGYLRTKKSAEELIRKYHGRTRPFSLYFTSRGDARVSADSESMIEQIRKSGSQFRVNANPEIEPIDVYQACLIDSGDEQARLLGELRVAASLSLGYQNNLGSVEGGSATAATVSVSVRGGSIEVPDTSQNTSVVQSTLQSKVAELVGMNSTYVRRDLEGLRAIITAVALDPWSFPKTILFISPGFVVGRNSRGDASTLLNDVSALARRRKIKIMAVDTGGSNAEVPVVSEAFPSIQGQAVSLMNSQATAFLFEKVLPLDQLSSRSGGKRLQAMEDIDRAIGSIIASTGALYYMAFLSRQPADGRFHKIGVYSNSRAVRLHARQGYYARAQTESGTAGALPAEDPATLAARAEEALKNGDYPKVASALEGLVKRFPARADLWFNLGLAQYNAKNASGAVEAFQRALALSPEDRTVGLMLSRSFVAAGNTDAAADTLQDMRRKNPWDLALLLQLGQVYEAGSQPARAFAVYRSALDITAAPPLDFYLLLIRMSALLKRNTETAIFIREYLTRGGEEGKVAEYRAK